MKGVHLRVELLFQLLDDEHLVVCIELDAFHGAIKDYVAFLDFTEEGLGPLLHNAGVDGDGRLEAMDVVLHPVADKLVNIRTKLCQL